MLVKEKIDPRKDPNFWENLENENKGILKWNPDGVYDRKFTTKEQMFLDKLHNLPEYPDINVGDTIKAKVSKIKDESLTLDINYKDFIFVDIKKADKKIISNIEIGDEINVLITQISNNPYMIKGSIIELIKIDANKKLREKYKSKDAIKVKILDMIPAGFNCNILIDYITIPAFMPNTLAGVNRLTLEQSNELIGQTIEVMLETLKQDRGFYVVSRRKYLQSLIPVKIEELKKELENDPFKGFIGKVTGTSPFGIFVEFNGCLTTMIHKTNINPKFQNSFQNISDGTDIEFYIKDIVSSNKGDKIIATQVYRESKWDTIKIGQELTGIICNIKDFGALVSFDEETMGLIQTLYIEKSKTKLEEGQEINVKVISIIKKDRKIYLDIV